MSRGFAFPLVLFLLPLPVVAQALRVLPAGTGIPLRTVTALDSKASNIGDRLALAVTEDVLLDGRVVIPAGSAAAGEVARIVRKGAFGKSGKIEVRLLYLTLGEQRVRIAGAVDDRGRSGTAATIGTTIAVGLLSFAITGTTARIAPDTPVAATLAQDLPFLVEPDVPR